MFNKLDLKLFFFLGIAARFSVAGEVTEADSLFTAQKYTEALNIYANLFEQNKYSPAMLLKIAFINEGLGNYAEALFFLDLYFNETANRNVIAKINELSEANHLSGYTYSDLHYFRVLLKKYKIPIESTLLALIILPAVYTFRKKRRATVSLHAAILQLLITAAILVINNEYYIRKEGIISEDQTLLFSGPSAGAERIEVIKKGHKVQVLEQLPVWYRISWNGDEAFVRKNKLLTI